MRAAKRLKTKVVVVTSRAAARERRVKSPKMVVVQMEKGKRGTAEPRLKTCADGRVKIRRRDPSAIIHRNNSRVHAAASRVPGLLLHTIVTRNALLLPGNPALGVVCYKNTFNVFVSKEAMDEFMRDPSGDISDAVEVAAGILSSSIYCDCKTIFLLLHSVHSCRTIVCHKQAME